MAAKKKAVKKVAKKAVKKLSCLLYTSEGHKRVKHDYLFTKKCKKK